MDLGTITERIYNDYYHDNLNQIAAVRLHCPNYLSTFPDVL
jgi:hypothetical protein